jgi:hypothetical protein
MLFTPAHRELSHGGRCGVAANFKRSLLVGNEAVDGELATMN